LPALKYTELGELRSPLLIIVESGHAHFNRSIAARARYWTEVALRTIVPASVCNANLRKSAITMTPLQIRMGLTVSVQD